MFYQRDELDWTNAMGWAGMMDAMKISELPQRIALHDSVVKKIAHSHAERTVRLEVELCNYMQASYREGEPEISEGTLAFFDVSHLESNLDLGELQWGEGVLDGEILTVKPSLEAGDGVEMVVQLMAYASMRREVLVLCVFGGYVLWEESAQSHKGG